MDKEELKELLKDNLKINVYTVGYELNTEVWFDNELITSSKDIMY